VAPARDEPRVLFHATYAIDAPGEVALEDYARVLTRAESAEALHHDAEPDRVGGVRLRGPAAEVTPSLRADIEDFARDLASRGGGNGLGWA
jgi:hypothetical protein